MGMSLVINYESGCRLPSPDGNRDRPRTGATKFRSEGIENGGSDARLRPPIVPVSDADLIVKLCRGASSYG